MAKDIVVFENVCKSFDLDRETSLKRKILNKVNQIAGEKFVAIDDVSFSIKEGESVGLWGENGSGKSTVLKLISGLYKPDRGNIVVKKTIASVLELGVGLHPDLTGRENIFFYSSVLNIPESRIKKNYDSIVDFFGFGDFIDVPIKRYSSGMKSRLAFSIAAFSEADILLFDEVMAVGDTDFKDKAMQKINELRKDRTIVFTAHSYSVIQQLCDRMISFQKGKIVKQTNSQMMSFLRNLDVGMEIKAEAASNSMAPTIKKGDLITIKKIEYDLLKIGDVVAFLFSNLDQMIVHRVVAKRETINGEIKCYTKGDFSYETDPWFLGRQEYLGKVVKIKKV